MKRRELVEERKNKLQEMMETSKHSNLDLLGQTLSVICAQDRYIEQLEEQGCVPNNNTIMINIKEEYAYAIAIFLGCQDISDTQNIVDKYGLTYGTEKYEQALQNLFNKLSIEIELEL